MLENEEFIMEFVEEALDHIEKVENNLLNIEKGKANPDAIKEMLRLTHSIKGAAGFFELKNIVELAHAMESLFGELRDGKILLNQKIIDFLFDANDLLKEMVMHVENSENTDISLHIENLLSVTKINIAEEKLDEDWNQTEGFTGENELTDSELAFVSYEKAAVRDALKHGHRLYKATVLIRETNLITLFKKFQSIGNLIESGCGLTVASKENEGKLQEGHFTFLFTSVLEKDLAAMALDLPQSYITEPYTDIEELEKIFTLHKAIENEEIHKQVDIPKADEVKNDEQIAVEDSVRVHTALLDDLLNLAGEMIQSRNQLNQIVAAYEHEVPALNLILKKAGHITKELQEKIMQTRMQPVANVFNRFPRIVRDLSRKLDKEVEVRMEGIEVGLDKSIIEALIDPLTHIIRNSVDHGIESPEIRINAGKNKAGTIIMKACHEGGYVKIYIIDDGAGIDIHHIREKAIEKGIVEKSEALLMSDSDLIKLLFAPGFSTKDKITDISGRGVGLDVVKTNIEKFGGSVDIDTIRGKGTTFRLILPLTIAIISSLIVEVQGMKYALPQLNLQEIVRIKPEDKQKKLESINNVKVLRLRDELLPAVFLSDILGMQVKEAHKNTDIMRVLIVKVSSGRFGLFVDAVHDSEEVLIKSLPVYFEKCELYSGATVLADGKIAMIIDPEGIASKVNLRCVDELNIANKKEKDKMFEEEEQQELVLFKCSGPETFGIDFSRISKVAEIDKSKIEEIGDNEYINYLGNPLRILRPEDYLPVRRAQNNCKKAYIIIPKGFGQPVGILIEKVYDNVKTAIKVDDETIKAKGLLGSSIINDKIVLLINLKELFHEAGLKE